MDNKIKSKELGQNRGASEVGKKKIVSDLGGKEVGVSKSGVRRSSIDWAIEELIDNRSLFGKLIGVGVPREKLLAQIDNINAIEEFFKEAGIKIPEDILKIFNRIGYITEAQAVELKKLAQQAMEAEKPKKSFRD